MLITEAFSAYFRSLSLYWATLNDKNNISNFEAGIVTSLVVVEEDDDALVRKQGHVVKVDRSEEEKHLRIYAAAKLHFYCNQLSLVKWWCPEQVWIGCRLM